MTKRCLGRHPGRHLRSRKGPLQGRSASSARKASPARKRRVRSFLHPPRIQPLPRRLNDLAVPANLSVTNPTELRSEAPSLVILSGVLGREGPTQLAATCIGPSLAQDDKASSVPS